MLPRVVDVFEGRSVFVTGASGFVGKVLVEKLLRSVGSLSTVFVLIRPMKGMSGEERWQQIESSVLFNQLRRSFPERLRKVVVLEGDITESDFGIDSEHLERMLAETSVVFHCAATVRFNESLKRAVNLNMRGVQRMISLCHRMPKLAAFLHCSSAFVNVDKPGKEKIREIIYPLPIDAHELLMAIDNLEDSQIEFLSAELTKKHLNTYCITKSLAEQLISLESSSLPVVIFRPSIIASIWEDGVHGWVDAYQGISVVLGSMYTGAMTSFPLTDMSSNPHAILDLVPVDVVVSMMIVCAAHRMNYDVDSLPIFHCCSTDLNPISMHTMAEVGQKYAMRYPAETLYSCPTMSFQGFHSIESYRHKLRAEVVGPVTDKLSTLLCIKPFWAKVYCKMRTSYTTLSPMAKYFHFETTNMMNLIEIMQEEDKKTFNFDVRKIDWYDYGSDQFMGMKTFLMRDDITSTRKMSRARLNLLRRQLLSLLPVYTLCYAISRVASGYITWYTFLPLLVVLTLFTLNDWLFTCTKIKSLDMYRADIEQVMGEPAMSLKKNYKFV